MRTAMPSRRIFFRLAMMALLGASSNPGATPALAAEPGKPDMRTWTEAVTGLEFVWIPGGCYTMGSPANEIRRDDDEHPHEVCVGDFWLSRYEVTNAQYRRFLPSHTSGQYEDHGLDDDAQPVVDVSWEKATAYAEWLAQKTGMAFRLPTEAEWEYAARAGTRTSHYWGEEMDQACRYANVADRTALAVFKGWIVADCEDGYRTSAPVGRFAPNAFGLYDMLGNVWEWTASSYDSAYSSGDEKRAVPKEEGGLRVIRGGSWYDQPRHLRAANRLRLTPGYRDFFLGFRLARKP
jgi:formylglycine-generating enzyme required for sulfatase activity